VISGIEWTRVGMPSSRQVNLSIFDCSPLLANSSVSVGERANRIHHAGASMPAGRTLRWVLAVSPSTTLTTLPVRAAGDRKRGVYPLNGAYPCPMPLLWELAKAVHPGGHGRGSSTDPEPP
jgi:hypothetical protein